MSTDSFPYMMSYCSKYSTIFLATASITFMQTELPNCLYACELETGIIKFSGNPCKRAHSLGVNILGFLSL